jgi:hypothetical protein
MMIGSEMTKNFEGTDMSPLRDQKAGETQQLIAKVMDILASNPEVKEAVTDQLFTELEQEAQAAQAGQEGQPPMGGEEAMMGGAPPPAMPAPDMGGSALRQQQPKQGLPPIPGGM